MKRVLGLPLFLLTLLLWAGPGSPAPDFELRDLHNRPVKLSSLRGKPVLLVFWATWCGPCRREMPLLIQVHHRYSPRGLRVLAVAVNARQDLEKVNQFAEDQGLPFTVLWDKEGKVGDEYKVTAIPTNVLLDGEGRVVYRTNSLNQALLRRLEGLLAPEPPPSDHASRDKAEEPSGHQSPPPAKD